jgi:hypothetical protein
MISADNTGVEARTRLLTLSGAALLVAGLVLVAVVLPAEYAVDPLGLGARLGVLPLGVVGQQVDALSDTASTRTGPATVVVDQDRPFRSEIVTFSIGPRESMEYKYRLEQGRALLYSWTASAPVNDEFHAEPDGGPKGYAETYQKGAARREASGTLTAPFAGIHGWFWENTTDQPVSVTLSTAGFYAMSHEFRPGKPVLNKTFQ